MFDRFSDRARHVAGLALDLADEQADPEHVLLAIGLEGQGVGAAILDRSRKDEELTAECRRLVGRGQLVEPRTGWFSPA